MSDKDFKGDFLTVKEFSKFVGMPVSTLHYYDSEGVFCPAKHGVTFKNKYRFYSPMQITTIKMIKVLKNVGVSLKDIIELNINRSPEKLIKLLTSCRSDVMENIRFFHEVLSVINTFLEQLIEGMGVTESNISVSFMSEKSIILGGLNDFNGSTDFYGEFIRFCEGEHEPRLNLSYPVGGYWSDMSEFSNEPSRPMRFFSLDPKGYEKRSEGLYLNGYTRGYYGDTGDLPQRMVAYAQEHGLTFTGPVYNIYLFDEVSISNPKEYLLQVSAAVTETRCDNSKTPPRWL
jgi:DNA-binding transcriptional MerR regulator